MNSAALKVMPWVFKSWERVKFFNTWCLGTLFPRIELDLIPGVFCSSHVIIYANQPLDNYKDYIAAGKAVQRFWLGCSLHGLSLQPEMTPLIFANYIEKDIAFTKQQNAYPLVQENTQKFRKIAERPLNQAAFLCRIGYGSLAKSRSTRKKFTDLISKNSL